MHHARARRIAALLAGLALAQPACAAAPWQRKPAADRDDVAVDVLNQNFYDATIYAVIGGERRRLGVVAGNSSERFTFAWSPLELRMAVDFVGGGGFVTDALAVDPGDELELIIQPDAHRIR